MTFMQFAPTRLLGVDCYVSRSGYTGEDGFEISVPAANAESLARSLLAETEVQAIGLGARDCPGTPGASQWRDRRCAVAALPGGRRGTG